MDKTPIDSFDSLDAALLHACEHADTSLAREALSRGANPDSVNEEHSSAVLIASYAGAADCLVELIASGASLGFPQKHFSPVYLAAMAGHEACLRVLIAAGADVLDQDGEGNSCALWAAKHGFSVALNMLAKAGAPMNVSNRSGERPILVAAEKGDMACLDVLLASGVGLGPDESCALSDSPLIAAAGSGLFKVVKRLLMAGADPAYKAYTSALAAAAGSGSLECLMALLEALGHWKDGKPGEPLRSTMPLLNAALGAHAGCVEAILRARGSSNVRSGLSSADLFYLNQENIFRAQKFVDCVMESKALGQAIPAPCRASPRKGL